MAAIENQKTSLAIMLHEIVDGRHCLRLCVTNGIRRDRERVHAEVEVLFEDFKKVALKGNQI